MISRFLKYWAPLCIYAGLIFYVSGIPRPLSGVELPFFDKLLHISEYAIFGYLASRAFNNSSRELFFRNFMVLAVLTSVLYGISDEIHQIFVSERQFSIFDMLADGIGGIIGTFAYNKFHKALNNG